MTSGLLYQEPRMDTGENVPQESYSHEHRDTQSAAGYCKGTAGSSVVAPGKCNDIVASRMPGQPRALYSLTTLFEKRVERPARWRSTFPQALTSSVHDTHLRMHNLRRCCCRTNDRGWQCPVDVTPIPAVKSASHVRRNCTQRRTSRQHRSTVSLQERAGWTSSFLLLLLFFFFFLLLIEEGNEEGIK